MIVKSGDKYVVKSADGTKTLSKALSHRAAVARLRAIEYFKHKR